MKETRKFVAEKTTKNTVKYQEAPEPGKPTIIGTLYVQKAALGGEPTHITVTVETNDE